MMNKNFNNTLVYLKNFTKENNIFVCALLYISILFNVFLNSIIHTSSYIFIIIGLLLSSYNLETISIMHVYTLLLTYLFILYFEYITIKEKSLIGISLLQSTDDINEYNENNIIISIIIEISMCIICIFIIKYLWYGILYLLNLWLHNNFIDKILCNINLIFFLGTLTSSMIDVIFRIHMFYIYKIMKNNK